ncbi:MAG: MBL fold metallo-hydrolase [Erysipelotrichaceae bacterium]|nr:MBL fold metallo-hydrolase [Erysipelotrichaceae bacterium]MDY5251959.1 MBL fold metallo-hydrolase [Erysipelotrichaceae bacterium]
MKITWIGHSCFKIEKDGYIIIIDPYEDDSVPGYRPIKQKAHLVLCSHEHSDHNYRQAIEILPAQSSPFTITTIATYHDDQQGSLRGSNNIHIMQDGKYKIAHLGDLGCELEPSAKMLLQDLDVLLIPVGGTYTLDYKQALALIDDLRPNITILMHYRDDIKGFGFEEIATCAQIKTLKDNVIVLNDTTLDLTTQHFNEQILILSPQNINVR